MRCTTGYLGLGYEIPGLRSNIACCNAHGMTGAVGGIYATFIKRFWLRRATDDEANAHERRRIGCWNIER